MASTPVFKFILSIFFSSIIIPSFSCPIHQKQALLHFKSKYSFKFAGLHSWNSTSDCCSWKRVNCSTTGSVTELHLSYVAAPIDFEIVPISSDILTPLFHIRSLEWLDVSANSYEGQIPGDGFGNLTKLLHLDISWNNFNGSIPSQLFQLTNLRYLDISDNNFNGSIPSQLFQLTNLRYLDISDNNFNGSIPSQLFQLTNLRYLDMGYNYLEGKLGPELGSFRKLTTLRLGDNRFQGPIPAQLFELESLQELDLAINKLGGGISPEIGPIPSSMQNLSKLWSLYLEDNMLTGEIPTSLFKIRTLKGLAIGGKGSKLIWNNTTKAKFLNDSSQNDWFDLDLSGNEIKEDSHMAGGLEGLDLSRNNFSGELPENIGNTTSFYYLAVSENDFSGLIPKSISNLMGLRSLDLSRNRLSGNLPVLGADNLDLSDNDFSGKIPANFPERTEILYLGGNKFAGSLPINLTKLVNLRVLDLRDSIITGNLQDILPQIPTLEILILRNTFLNGFIPNSISKCTSLRILDLSRNNLTGRIPRQIANLPRMNMSASSYPISHLTGKPLEDLLQDLIVSWKKYPQQLRNLHFFVLLDLSGNNISGEIPASLGNLKALKQLNISHNKISGNIPMSLGNLTSIESFDVSHNELSVKIFVVDVSANSYEGQIPGDGFGNLTKLLHLNMQGPIPAQLFALESLQDLDLRYNNLGGGISPEIGKLRNLG
ncbi:leucine-rich repeat-containing protein [Tanacetum coccineum]